MPFAFGQTPTEEATSESEQPTGQDFWAERKEAHEQLFAELYASKDQYDDFDGYFNDLFKASWQFTEKTGKISFANGVKKGSSWRQKNKAQRKSDA